MSKKNYSDEAFEDAVSEVMDLKTADIEENLSCAGSCENMHDLIASLKEAKRAALALAAEIDAQLKEIG